jgi:hypothetical protein
MVNCRKAIGSVFVYAALTYNRYTALNIYYV